MNIVYWSDYACPFCYIGETHMKQALKNLDLCGERAQKGCAGERLVS